MLTVYAAIHRRLLTFTIRVWYKLILLEVRYLYDIFDSAIRRCRSIEIFRDGRGPVKVVIEKKSNAIM